MVFWREGLRKGGRTYQGRTVTGAAPKVVVVVDVVVVIIVVVVVVVDVHVYVFVVVVVVVLLIVGSRTSVNASARRLPFFISDYRG